MQVVSTISVENLSPFRIKPLPLLACGAHRGNTDAVILATVRVIAAIKVAFQDHKKMILWVLRGHDT
jgi:hypothetical protein